MAGPATNEALSQTLALARTLIACPSITPDDGGCLDLIAERLRPLGFACERIDRQGVRNLWATHSVPAVPGEHADGRRDAEPGPLVCLAGHVDVVPPGPTDQWTGDPFAPEERDGFLYGRGAADMKASVAAMITALERLVTSQPAHPGTVALLLTSDEEGDATDGTAAVVDALRARGVRIDACLLGEPTSTSLLGDTIKNGRRGSLNGLLRIYGTQCHVAYPERGRNPINTALAALAELAAAEWDRGSEYFPATGFQISNIHAGTGAFNVVPSTMDVWFNFRFSPESTRETLRARVYEMLDRHGLTYDLQWTLTAEPFVTPRGLLVETLAGVILSETGVEPELSTSGGTSDGRFLTGIAREVVEFGPVNLTIHKIDECVAVSDLGPLTAIYERTVARCLNGPFER